MKKVPPPKESCAQFGIPIYDVAFFLVVTDDLLRSRLRRSGWLGVVSPGWEAGSGLCSFHGHRFALFAQRRYLCHDLIAHEVFHLTHRILESSSVPFKEDNHEVFAYLNGWLSEKVYGELRRLGERVKPRFPPRRLLPGEPPTAR